MSKKIIKKSKKNKKTKKRRQYLSKKGGQSKMYTLEGNIIDIPDKNNDKNIFRKQVRRNIELIISKKIMENPNPYIVTIYDVNIDNSTVDMELLNTNYEMNDENIAKIQRTIKEALQHLHSINIMYIDWKYDNIGLTSDGTFKLFDFDSSGIATSDNKEWLIRKPGSNQTWSPPASYAWAIALINHITIPLCADNFICFLFINNMLDGIDHVTLYKEP